MEEFRNFELNPFVFQLDVLEKTISEELEELKFSQSQKEEIYRAGFSEFSAKIAALQSGFNRECAKMRNILEIDLKKKTVDFEIKFNLTDNA